MWQHRLLIGCLSFYVATVTGCVGPTANQQGAKASVQLQEAEEILRTDQLIEKKMESDFDKFQQLKLTAQSPNFPPPPPLPTPDSKLISDIACRRKLVFLDQEEHSLESPSKAYGLPPRGTSIGETWNGCEELAPQTRLLFENAVAGASDTYTNQAGYLGSASPIVQQTQNVYQFGIGYSQKPILKQLRRLLDGSYYRNEPDPAIGNQGYWAEDFIFNAVLLNAGIAYGQSLVIKNGTAATTSYARPVYSVGATYALDLERAYVDIVYGLSRNSRPADPGYYFTPPSTPLPYAHVSPGFWQPYKF